MKLIDVIRHAQGFSRRPGFTELREDYLKKHSDCFSCDSRRVFEDEMIQRQFASPLKLIPVESVLKAARVKTKIPSIGIVCVDDSEFVQRAGYERSVHSYVEMRKEMPTVVYRQSDRFCWQRFSIIKELLHIYTDTATDADPLAVDAARSVGDALDSLRGFPDAQADLPNETVALVMAIEVMIPWCIRHQLKALLDKGADCLQIAKAFMIPRDFVEWIFGGGKAVEFKTGRPYAEISWKVNEEVEPEFTGRF